MTRTSQIKVIRNAVSHESWPTARGLVHWLCVEISDIVELVVGEGASGVDSDVLAHELVLWNAGIFKCLVGAFENETVLTPSPSNDPSDPETRPPPSGSLSTSTFSSRKERSDVSRD